MSDEGLSGLTPEQYEYFSNNVDKIFYEMWKYVKGEKMIFDCAASTCKYFGEGDCEKAYNGEAISLDEDGRCEDMEEDE